MDIAPTARPRSGPAVYRPREPQATPLYRLLEARYEAVKGEWEERFESRFGLWRACVDGAVTRYLDCGILDNGFARLRCTACRKDMLVAFSCKGRGLCPSCVAKRAAETAARLREDVLEAVGHAQWVFVPKMLRPYFLRHRELLGDLCRASWQTVREMMVAAAGEQVRPGMVAVVQTFGSTINFHPHVHAIVSRGGWTKGGDWVPLPWVDARAAELLFRHKVLLLLRKAGLIDDQRVALLLSGKHTGFSVHNSVTVQPQDAGASERLVRYFMRAPVSQQRLDLDPHLGQVRLRSKARADHEPAANEVERLDPDEVVARILVQIPEPRKHLIHSYGRYANAARAKRNRDAAAESQSLTATAAATGSAASEPDSAERKAAHKRWANLPSPLLRSRSSHLSSLRRDDEDHLLHHRTASHSQDSRFGAANLHAIHGRLAPPPTRRSPGHGWHALKGEQAKERGTRANINRSPRSACASPSGAL